MQIVSHCSKLMINTFHEIWISNIIELQREGHISELQTQCLWRPNIQTGEETVFCCFQFCSGVGCRAFPCTTFQRGSLSVPQSLSCSALLVLLTWYLLAGAGEPSPRIWRSPRLLRHCVPASQGVAGQSLSPLWFRAPHFIPALPLGQEVGFSVCSHPVHVPLQQIFSSIRRTTVLAARTRSPPTTHT